MKVFELQKVSKNGSQPASNAGWLRVAQRHWGGNGERCWVLMGFWHRG